MASLQDARNDMRVMGAGVVPETEIVRRLRQQIEYRSSFPGCVDRQMSFGVVETPFVRLLALSRGNMRPQKGCSLLIPLF